MAGKVLLMVAYRSTKIVRVLFSIVFISAYATNLSAGLTNHDVYLDYAN